MRDHFATTVLLVAAVALLIIWANQHREPTIAMSRVTIPAQLAPCPVVKPRGLPTERKA